MTGERKIKIVSVGGKGDGVADDATFVPGALPGELWCRHDDGKPERRGPPSPQRRQPPCRYFGRCGGCSTQHMTPDFYQSWKQSILETALSHRRIEARLDLLDIANERSRRRARFQFALENGDVALGYHRAAAHEIVNIDDCLLLDPRLSDAIPSLRRIVANLFVSGTKGVIELLAADDGLAALITGPDLRRRPAPEVDIAALAASANIGWLSVATDSIVRRYEPLVTVNGARVSVTPGQFLQAVPDIEARLAEMVASAAGKARKVADLFAGVGTLTFPLAKRARVNAFEADGDAVKALSDAVKRNQGYKPINVRRRDLFRDPLSVRELQEYEVVVLDPPRAGAAAQIERLAKSKVPLVVMVSCQPSTFARDAFALIQGGYELTNLRAFDQFLYSPHLEVVGIFQRSRPLCSNRST